jgi:hypothetical protein
MLGMDLVAMRSPSRLLRTAEWLFGGRMESTKFNISPVDVKLYCNVLRLSFANE